jgi:hypothetical protein
MQRIAALYAVEALIRGEPAEIRLKVRAERSEKPFAELRKWLDTTLSRVSGRGEMAKAIRYALARWDALTPRLRRDKPGAARWSRVHRQQRRRTLDAADDSWTQKLVVRGIGFRRGARRRSLYAH